MNEKEIREKYIAKKCDTQIQFDRVMSEMNEEQAQINHPYIDRLRELAKKRELLMQQKEAINIQLAAIKVERIDIEQKQKELNRVFHDIKHELIMLNPREGYAKIPTEA